MRDFLKIAVGIALVAIIAGGAITIVLLIGAWLKYLSSILGF